MYVQLKKFRSDKTETRFRSHKTVTLMRKKIKTELKKKIQANKKRIENPCITTMLGVFQKISPLWLTDLSRKCKMKPGTFISLLLLLEISAAHRSGLVC